MNIILQCSVDLNLKVDKRQRFMEIFVSLNKMSCVIPTTSWIKLYKIVIKSLYCNKHMLNLVFVYKTVTAFASSHCKKIELPSSNHIRSIL